MEIIKFVEKNFNEDFVACGRKEEYIDLLRWINIGDEIDTQSKNWDMLYTMTLHQGSLSAGAFPAAILLIKKIKRMSDPAIKRSVAAFLIETEALRHVQRINIPDWLEEKYTLAFRDFLQICETKKNTEKLDFAILSAIEYVRNHEYQLVLDALDSIE